MRGNEETVQVNDAAADTTAGVLRDLEPSVGRLLDRHLGVAREWFPHQYVPWSGARDFDGPLDGTAWDPRQSALPQAVQDALLVNLLTEDNLPSYHFEIATRFGRDGAWGTWVHRWTAEEDRHACVMRAYVHARRAMDPVALEELRMRQVGAGYRSDLPTVLHALAYVTVQELATRQAHRNVGVMCGDPVGEQLMARIAADENLHMLFYRDLYADALRMAPDAALTALTDVICGFQMPGTTIPGFRARALRVAAAGIFDLDVHSEHVVRPLLRALGVMSLPGLGPAGEQARQRLGQHLEWLRAQASRARELYERMNASGGPGRSRTRTQEVTA
ncbi:acyl-ACP desaturase [Streptantibioticus rubrisoli]|uniref:Acyl-ACP desaturase n=1 Tax=Streptantibioticus rubrisoli TaxID=1387313 RepID=A0ABT1P8G9_9ACTN|nr:acyl-ACP desaturase [Streptantibioticus rubrisoli]MCQ4041665.1 acyl-ACP desaturase [Streptantibioticus rubrisoli]